MNTLVRFLVGCWMRILAMIGIAMWWVQDSHVRFLPEGPVLVKVSPNHGIHVLDLLFLTLEILLAFLLTGVLWRGFTADVGNQAAEEDPAPLQNPLPQIIVPE